MSDRGPFALARSRAGSGSHMDTSGGPGGAAGNGNEKGDKFDHRGNNYDIRHLFNILLIAFSSVPTTVFLAWILSWGIVILYLCTFGFAIGVACVTGLSMFVYGPVLCFCIISAFGCSLVYNVARYSWETTWAALNIVRRVLFSLLAGPSPGDRMSGMTGGGGSEEGEDSMWSSFAWLRGGDDNKHKEDEGVIGWGTLDAPSKEPDWGTQPLEQKFETRQALPGAMSMGPGPGIGGGGARKTYMPAGTGIAGGGSPLAGSVAGHGGRKGSVRPAEEVVPPYHIRR
ncbi:hypothetical protein BGW39_003469 [Mortierella sp. 14UC]|nr:hypothetical protein BGW39_003469 [Mortierella sp. 14UC]